MNLQQLIWEFEGWLLNAVRWAFNIIVKTLVTLIFIPVLIIWLLAVLVHFASGFIAELMSRVLEKTLGTLIEGRN